MQLINKEFINTHGVNEILINILGSGNSIMLVCFNRSDFKIHACNRYFKKRFRISSQIKSDLYMSDIMDIKLNNFKPNISMPGKKPVTNIIHSYNNSSFECFFYEYNDEKSLLMYIQPQLLSDLDMIEKMAEVTTEMAEVTRELRKKNHELHQTRDAMVYQSRNAATADIIKMIAHQWRQPLSGIASIVTLLQFDNEIGSVSKEFLGQKLIDIDNIVQNLSSTIKELYSMYDNDTKLEDISLSQSIDKAISIMQKNIDDLNAKIVLNYLPTITCNSSKSDFLQCVIGILKNSLEALAETKNSNPVVNISTSEKDDNILIEIEDNAGGIDEENLSRVFEPYFSTKSLNGRGLGLYMIKMTLIDKMSGGIKIENIKDGTKVTINLPAKR